MQTATATETTMPTDLFGTPVQTSPAVQAGFEYPQPLTEKYAPMHVSEFVGLEQAKKVAANVVASPAPRNLLFIGPSGTGKTRMARAIANDMPAQVHHVASGECDVKSVRELRFDCQYGPCVENDWSKPAKMHLLIVDEADGMSRAAQDAFLSILDGTNRPHGLLCIFTANSTEKLEDRFLSRCQVIKFSSYGILKETADLLAQVWAKESAPESPAPNFARIVKDSANNVRAALMALETEIMSA